MRWWHLEQVLLLEADLFGDEAWTAGMYWSELAEAETRDYVVAVNGTELLGYAGLCTYVDEAWVQTIGVARRHQGAGLGTGLLRTLLRRAAERAVPMIALEVRADNAAAQQLYARHGFEAVGLRRGYYQLSGIDAVVMRRDATQA